MKGRSPRGMSPRFPRVLGRSGSRNCSPSAKELAKGLGARSPRAMGWAQGLRSRLCLERSQGCSLAGTLLLAGIHLCSRRIPQCSSLGRGLRTLKCQACSRRSSCQGRAGTRGSQLSPGRSRTRSLPGIGALRLAQESVRRPRLRGSLRAAKRMRARQRWHRISACAYSGALIL